MTKYMFGFLLISPFVYGQNSFSNKADINLLKQFNISYYSPTTLLLLKNELYALDSTDYINTVRSFDTKIPTKEFLDSYKERFNTLVLQTQSMVSSHEFKLALADQIKTSQVGAANFYTNIKPTSAVMNFYNKALLQGIEYYKDTLYHDFVFDATKRTNLDSLVLTRLNLLLTNGAKISSDATSSEFRDLFINSQGEIPSLDKADPLYNALSNYAYNYIRIAGNVTKIKHLTPEEHESAMTDYLKEIRHFEKTARSSVTTGFEFLIESINELAANQNKVNSVINELERSILDCGQKLHANNEEIGKYARLNNEAAVSLLKRQQETLIQKIVFQSNIVAGYVNNTLNTVETLRNLPMLKDVFTAGEYSKIEVGVKTISTTETLIGAAADFANAAASVYNSLVSPGLAKTPAGQAVGKFISYAQTAINLGSGIARVFAGDLTGIVSVFKGISSLFGGGPPPESVELQYMKKMHEDMNKQFGVVNQKLDIINKKMDGLIELVLNSYKATSATLSIIQAGMTELKETTNVLSTKVDLLNLNDYAQCYNIQNANSLKEYYTNFNTASSGVHWKTCVNKILTMVPDPNGEFRYDVRAYNFYYLITGAVDAGMPSANVDIINKNTWVLHRVNDVFQPTIDYFKGLYSIDANLALNTLTQPVTKTRFNHHPYIIGSKLASTGKVPETLSSKKILDQFYDADFIHDFARQYLKINTFAECYNGGSQNFLKLKEILRRDVEQRKKQIQDEINALQNLRAVADYSIIQQSILSGQSMLTAAYLQLTSSTNDTLQVNRLKKIIKYNKLFSRNLAVYVLNQGLDTEMKKKTFVDSYMESGVKIKTNIENINSFITHKAVFALTPSTDSLSLNFSVIIGKDTISNYAPTATEVINDEMAYSDSFYKLADIRKSIETRLFECLFTERLANGSKSELGTFKKYFFSYYY